MSCCGSQRAAMRQGSMPSGRSASSNWTPGSLEFEYNGTGELRITGPMTGSVYVFAGNGSRAVVHSADVASLTQIPNLRPRR
jgi:hypothetical protein